MRSGTKGRVFSPKLAIPVRKPGSVEVFQSGLQSRPALVPAPERNLSQRQKLSMPRRKKRARGTAGAEGTVIACHTRDELDAQMAKAYEADKLVRTPSVSL